MSIEYIGEKIFLEEIEITGEVWVAKGIHQNIYSQELDKSGLSLPVWSTNEKALDFLKNARLTGTKYEPHSVPLKKFANAWLSDQSMGISLYEVSPRPLH